MTYPQFIESPSIKAAFESSDISRQEIIAEFFEEQKNLHSISVWGQEWLKMVRLATAHELELYDRGQADIPILGQVTSISSSHGSGSVGAKAVEVNKLSDYYSSTPWGLRYWRLRKKKMHVGFVV